MYSHKNVLFILSDLHVPIAWYKFFWWLLCVYYVPIEIVTNWKFDVRDLVVFCVCFIDTVHCIIRDGHVYV